MKSKKSIRVEKLEIENNSIIEKLKKEKKINDELLTLFNFLSLEDLISLKLEITFKFFKGKFLGFPIFQTLENMVKFACYNSAKNLTDSKKSSANFLGISELEFEKLERRFERLKS